MPIGDILAQISGDPSPSPTASTAPTLTSKRKANDEMKRPVGKLQRTSSSTATKQGSQAQRPIPVDAKMSKMRIDTNTQRPTPNSASTTFKNGQPTPPACTEPAKPPKKGSYAEVMARAKAAQATLGQVGKIQHKRIEKAPTKRELGKTRTQKGRAIQNGLKSDSKFQKPGEAPLRNGQNGNKPGSVKPTPPVPEKKFKKAAMATTGYAGTARPKPGGGQPSTQCSATSISSRNGSHDRYRGKKRLDSYIGTDEDEDEEEEEDIEEDDYASDVSSDMEAGLGDVEDEEMQAERIARREDALALEEENRLKREKAEKRERLAAMAKSRR